VVNFGDPIPEKELRLSLSHSQRSDIFVAIGSSLAVTPAADMPVTAKRNGAVFIIINKMKTGLDRFCDIRFFEGAGFVLGTIVSLVKKV
jgi:NAD-dependent SIR2 family protein deacetylase